MRNRSVVLLAGVLVSALVIYGCTPRSRYEKRLEKELASGVRYDSLFLGLYFGMPEKDFYTHCWMLNREGMIKQGPDNTTVEYELKHELKYPATMNFYPGYADGKIYEMPVRFAYNGWAPWNKALSSDSLQLDVVKWYKKIYGGGFIEVAHPKRGLAFVKIDGNRRITIFKEDDLHVWAVFTDMLVKNALDSSNSEMGRIHNDITKDLGR